MADREVEVDVSVLVLMPSIRCLLRARSNTESGVPSVQRYEVEDQHFTFKRSTYLEVDRENKLSMVHYSRSLRGKT